MTLKSTISNEFYGNLFAALFAADVPFKWDDAANNSDLIQLPICNDLLGFPDY